jgi:hypothetical protein
VSDRLLLTTALVAAQFPENAPTPWRTDAALGMV